MSIPKKHNGEIPRGFTIEEVADNRKEKLVDDYEFIKQKLQEVRNKEQELSTIRESIRKKQIEYRIESVQRVLDYIRGKKITDSSRLDLLLCHCQNKLNGNIDGIELTLKEEEKKE